MYKSRVILIPSINLCLIQTLCIKISSATKFSLQAYFLHCQNGGNSNFLHLQDASRPAKGKRGTEKGKRGRELTIVIVVFHITTIVGESSQKLNKIGKTFSSRCGVYLAISRNDKSI